MSPAKFVPNLRKALTGACPAGAVAARSSPLSPLTFASGECTVHEYRGSGCAGGRPLHTTSIRRAVSAVAAALFLIGLALCIGAIRVPWRRTLGVFVVFGLATAGVIDQSSALVAVDNVYTPIGTWNNYRVFLSSPRHANSGSRGECGWEENHNGRSVNYHAADGYYYQEVYNTTHEHRNLRSRGYRIMVSRNTRDDGFLANRTTGNNWGAHVYIVTHTNAINGCLNNNTNYLLTMFNGSSALANALGTNLDPVLPNNWNQWSATWAELYANAPHRAYVEFVFHDNVLADQWFQQNYYKVAWRYGLAIDQHLGYP